MKEWRTREAAFPMCLPATLRILNPSNLFCNMQCTTVCITAAGSRVAKRKPGTCPGGLRDKSVGPPQRGVSRRSENRSVVPATGRVAHLNQASQGILRGVLERRIKQVWCGETRATPPPNGTGRSVGEGFSGEELLGWVTGWNRSHSSLLSIFGRA